MSDMAVKPCFLFSLTFWNSGATLRLGGAKLLIDRFMPPEPECRVVVNVLQFYGTVQSIVGWRCYTLYGTPVFIIIKPFLYFLYLLEIIAINVLSCVSGIPPPPAPKPGKTAWETPILIPLFH